jgi:betaine-aldehyde dehydrogenase
MAQNRFEAHQQSFIDIYKLENGKPEALQEISRIAPAMRYWSAMARTLKGESGHPSPDDISITSREPIGVAGIITPWNSPIILCMRSVNPALAAGCTVACKMPGQTAQVSTLLAQFFSEVEGLPRGVANFFNESASGGAQWLVSSPDARDQLHRRDRNGRADRAGSRAAAQTVRARTWRQECASRI